MSKKKTNWHDALIMFINDECPPGKDFEKCSFTANCSGCWDTWIERQEKVVDKPTTVGDMTLREASFVCAKTGCRKCFMFDDGQCVLGASPYKWNDEMLDRRH